MIFKENYLGKDLLKYIIPSPFLNMKMKTLKTR